MSRLGLFFSVPADCTSDKALDICGSVDLPGLLRTLIWSLLYGDLPWGWRMTQSIANTGIITTAEIGLAD